MEDELEAIHQALTETGLYVDEGMRKHVSDEEIAQIEANLAEVDAPVHVIAVTLEPKDVWAGSPEELVTRLHDAYGDEGHYFVASHVFDEHFRLTHREYDVPTGDRTERLAWIVDNDTSDVGATLVDLTGILAEGTLAERYEEWSAQVSARSAEMRAEREAEDSGLSPVVTVGGGLLLLVVLWVLVRKAFARRTVQQGAFVLPASAVDRIRDARDRSLQQRARADLLALGEAIDAEEIAEGDDRSAWQSALDHYEAADKILSADPGILDVVGVIVLAGRGHDALAAARSGKPHVPSKPCFLNPLHGAASGNHAVTSGSATITAPLCRACQKALERGSTPEVLDVLEDGKPVHYFESSAEPWASTGYGALETDLVRRLQGGR
ncbi:hypothetical protein [Nocardioides sp. AE5]|uniref:hypothetical protein n=1 Tax=Nocardioides sp. AE5 TaxID=2962573 RepID=UPI002881476A|nr:hypothetical protein [Nocardioides sp. AE5]MDT0201924.1 hypothetical protein [Nocardioides sp. AE5]